jgi:hypothetical protein
MKHIKVSDTVHEELSNRKYREESFDEVLKRELGLLPENINDVTIGLPERLKVATRTIIGEHIDDTDRFKKIGEQGENKQVLHFISKETEKLIFEVVVYQPDPNERINHRLDIRYQNQSGELERILQLRDIERGAVDIEYKDKETHGTSENTRKGDSPGVNTANDFGPHVSEFVEQAYALWGTATSVN